MTGVHRPPQVQDASERLGLPWVERRTAPGACDGPAALCREGRLAGEAALT
jgi:hypothetical protein